MRMVPVDSGVGEMHVIGKSLAGRDGTLREVGYAVESVIESNAVPVDRRRLIERVDELDHDRRALG